MTVFEKHIPIPRAWFLGVSYTFFFKGTRATCLTPTIKNTRLVVTFRGSQVVIRLILFDISMSRRTLDVRAIDHFLFDILN